MNILNGKEVASKIKSQIKIKVDELVKMGITPKLVTISVGNDKAFDIYTKNKEKECENVGIKCETVYLNSNTAQSELLDVIQKLNEKEDVSGIIIQSPVPSHIDINEVFSAISPKKDVDGFNPINIGKLMLGQETMIPCAAKGIMALLAYYNIEIEETLQKVVQIKANSLSEAIDKVEEKYRNEEYILNEEDFKGVEFNEYVDIQKKQRNSRLER